MDQTILGCKWRYDIHRNSILRNNTQHNRLICEALLSVQVTLNITTFSIIVLTATQLKDAYFIVMLNAVMLSLIMLGVIMLNVAFVNVML
jgi:hypothetical protein